MQLIRVLSTWLAGLGLLLAFQAVCAQPLATQEVEARTVPQWRTFDGTVAAVNRSTVAAQTSGTVQTLHVDVGDYVPAGTVIVNIDDTVQRAGLEQSRAALAEARAGLTDAASRFDRVRGLFERKAISKAEYDQAQAAYSAARARVAAGEAAVRQAEQQLSYTRVTAPYDGVVVERQVDVGETVSPGSPLMTGLSLNRLRVEIDVPQRLAAAVRKAGSADVALPDGTTLASDALTFFPVADPATHDFRVRVELPKGDHGLYPGMNARVRIGVGTREALLIPASAVLYRSELRAVYVVASGGQPALRQVRLGDHHDGRVEVLAGLSAGERIARDPVAAMARGAGRRPDE
ncbi:MAG TPA: efflux RND transporter periplasmic adaptor subunit [Gammaproteobacteria bacterium]|nr:efflux RND transporter periplasmic adaptor subunit [Gammaproteobacteria bacterium]